MSDSSAPENGTPAALEKPLPQAPPDNEKSEKDLAPSEVSAPAKLAAKLLLGVVISLVIVIFILVVLPLMMEVAEEDDLGVAYLAVLRVNMLHFLIIVIDLVLGAITFSALWHSDLERHRTWLLRGCLLGILLTITLYGELTTIEEINQNLWQGEGPPGHEDVMSYIGTFAWGNLVFFVVVIAGIIGASYRDLIKRIVPGL